MKIITISREFGSGGRELGHRLAELLGVPCYDQALIDLAAARQGIDPSQVERIPRQEIPICYALTAGRRFEAPPTAEPSLRTAVAQQEVLRRLARQGGLRHRGPVCRRDPAGAGAAECLCPRGAPGQAGPVRRPRPGGRADNRGGAPAADAADRQGPGGLPGAVRRRQVGQQRGLPPVRQHHRAGDRQPGRGPGGLCGALVLPVDPCRPAPCARTGRPAWGGAADRPGQRRKNAGNSPGRSPPLPPAGPSRRTVSGMPAHFPAVKKPHWERRTARRRCFRLRARLSAHPGCRLGGFCCFVLSGQVSAVDGHHDAVDIVRRI